MFHTLDIPILVYNTIAFVQYVAQCVCGYHFRQVGIHLRGKVGNPWVMRLLNRTKKLIPVLVSCLIGHTRPLYRLINIHQGIEINIVLSNVCNNI